MREFEWEYKDDLNYRTDNNVEDAGPGQDILCKFN